MSRNLKITLAYDGAEFHGWQVQPGFPTVQGILAECLGRITGEDVLPQGSGRTDAGVHALAQVASVRLNSPIPERNLLIALNDILPPSVRVTGVEVVADDFHARHSAKAKTYRYRIYRGEICPPFLARYVYHDPYPMDEDAMMRASEYIVGTFDFTSFAARTRSAARAWLRQLRKAPESRSARSPNTICTMRPRARQIDADDEDATDALSLKQGNVRTVIRRCGCARRTSSATPCAETDFCITWCAIWWDFSAGGQRIAEGGGRARHSRRKKPQRCRSHRARLRAVPGQRGVRNVMSTVTQVATRETIISTNPATGEKLAELACATPEEVHEAVRRARQAQPAWQALPVNERVAVLKRFQRKLSEQRDEVATLISREAGKPTAEALTTEILVVLDAAEFCIRTAHSFLRDEPLPHGNLAMKTKRGKLVREPYGVIGIIAPWNYPFSTPAIETLAALVMGNAVVLKPSEFTPLVALELQKLLLAAGSIPT